MFVVRSLSVLSVLMRLEMMLMVAVHGGLSIMTLNGVFVSEFVVVRWYELFSAIEKCESVVFSAVVPWCMCV